MPGVSKKGRTLMAKKIPFNLFKEGQYLEMNIGRLQDVETMLKKPLGEILSNVQVVNLTLLTAVLAVALRDADGSFHAQAPKYYAAKIQKYLDENDHASIEDITEPVLKSIVSTGILGKDAYLSVFPEDATEDLKRMAEKEKNA